MSGKSSQAMEAVTLAVLNSLESELDQRIQEIDEEDIETIRARRREVLKKEAENKKRWIANGHGTYSEIFDEKEFFNVCKSSERVIVHFYRPSNEACEVMNKHLADIARRHVETKIVKINAEKTQFLAERLKIWMLPTVVLVRDGRTEHSIVGFEELGNTARFGTHILEQRLVDYFVLDEPKGGVPFQGAEVAKEDIHDDGDDDY
eukprot:ANDGO_04688.mRNA.1 Thioredoxin domain-containing protein 9 homolog